MGPFGLSGLDGARIPLPSKKGAALVAMLAMSRGGERTRSWLQDRLWGSRERLQAQASLRNELLRLRQALNTGPTPLLLSDGDRVRIDLGQVTVDARRFDDDATGDSPGEAKMLPGEFLEGFDIPGEEGFEEWLREQRSALDQQVRDHESGVPAQSNGAAARTPELIFEQRPSIAILPFSNLTRSEEHGYLADGLAEEMIDGVARLRWLPVIAASSSFIYRDSGDSKLIADALGVRYILSGRLKGTPGEFTLSLSLFEAETGRVSWTHRHALPSILSRATTDMLVRDVVAALDTGVDFAEQERVLAKRAESLSVTEKVWRARWHINRFTQEDAVIAKTLIDEALATQPNSSDALIQSTYTYAWSIWSLREPQSQIQEMRKLAQRAIAADPLDGRSHMLAGMAETWLRRPTQAKQLLGEAIGLNPSLSHAHAMLGSARYLNGEAGDAIAPLETAIRLSPHDGQMFRVLGELAVSHYMLGDWDRAINYAEQSLSHRPGFWYAHVVRIAALADKGDAEAAAARAAELKESKPGFNAEQLDWLPFVDARWPRQMKDRLQQSG